MIKLLLGGSPCTHWSIAQKNNRETEAEGIGWELFRNYLIAKEKFKPNYFLYENNKSAAKPIKDQIAKELGAGVPSLFQQDNGIRFTYINSALVSAQNRQRFYVTNWGDIHQPADRGILLKDILETGVVDKEKDYCLKHLSGNARDYFKKHHTNIAFDEVCEPVRIGDIGSTAQAHRVYSAEGKTVTINSGGGGQGGKTGLYTVPIEPIRVCSYSNKGQGYRVYSDEGKAIAQTANSGGDGSYTGLYATPIDDIEGKSHTITASYYKAAETPFSQFGSEAGRQRIAEPATGNHKPIYEVKNGLITIKDKQYPIKLQDGFYIIRKLTVTECCRLQTMPDDYCRAVSASQGYRGLGNGWTAEVIIELFKQNKALMAAPKDEKIVVLSMYDGIGTGRYVLDQLGFTNIKYHAYEIDKYAMQISMSNYPDIIQHGDAFELRNDDCGLV